MTQPPALPPPTYPSGSDGGSDVSQPGRGYSLTPKREDETGTDYALRIVTEQARWDARREIADMLRRNLYDCPAEFCTHGNEFECAADLIDAQDDLAPPEIDTEPPVAPVPCRNCGDPVSDSRSYGWLHVGGWKLCAKRGGGVARPVVTPSQADRQPHPDVMASSAHSTEVQP